MTTTRCQDTKYRSLSEEIYDMLDERGTWSLLGNLFLALDSNDNCKMPRHYCTKYCNLSELIFDLVDVRGTWCLFSAHPLSVSGQASR